MKVRELESCRYDAVCLGEVMLRLDPGNRRVRTARTFQVWEGGGEYNVARGLRRCFGLRTATAVSQLRPGDVDWEHLFGTLGVRWLHTGGIFAALSDTDDHGGPRRRRRVRRRSRRPGNDHSRRHLDGHIARRATSRVGRLRAGTTLTLTSPAWSAALRVAAVRDDPVLAISEARGQPTSPAMRLIAPATITTPNTYDSRAWESTVRRIRGLRMSVSDTWYVIPMVKATYAKSR
jgi:hypothetical protein